MNEEIKKLADELNNKWNQFDQVTKDLNKSLEGKAATEKIDSLQKSQNELKESIDKLAKQADAIELQMKQEGSYKSPKSAKEQLREGIIGIVGDKDFRNKLKSAGQQGIGFQIKTGTPLTVATNFGARDRDTAVIEVEVLPGIGKAPDRELSLLSIVPKGTTSSNQIFWTERTARTEGAAAKAEGTPYGESSYTWQKYGAAVEKFPVFTKIVEEMLMDGDYIVSEIFGEHLPELQRLLETESFTATGTGTAPHILSVITNAAAYTSTALQGKVTNPNTYDCVRATINQLKESNSAASHICMNPADLAELELQKDSTTNYLRLNSDGRIWRLPVVESSQITAGKLLVGDFSKMKMFFKGGIEVRLYDQNESDPIYGLYTLVSKVFAANKIQHCDYSAFVYDDIEDIKNLL